MQRKWTTLALTMATAALLTAGLALAASPDDGGPLEKIMEKVGAKNNVIKKATKTAVSYKKGQKDVAEAAKDLAKLAKEAKEIKDAAKGVKGVDMPVAKWDALMDDMIKASEHLAEVAGSNDKLEAAKEAFAPVTKSCGACHNVFKDKD